MTDLTEAKRLVEEASWGPWNACEPDADGTVYVDSLDGHQPVAMILTGSPHNQDRADAAFIVWARNNLPTLLAEHEAALAEVERLRAGVNHSWLTTVGLVSAAGGRLAVLPEHVIGAPQQRLVAFEDPVTGAKVFEVKAKEAQP